MRQIPLAITEPAAPGFDNFLVGANAAAVAALRELRAPAAPLYLHGPAGSGKSHLLAALAARVRVEGGAVGHFDAATALPWTFDERWSLILIDQAELLDEARQHAAFLLFVEAAAQQIPIVAAARLPVVDRPLREDLRTRFGWGPAYALQPLDEAGTRAALRRAAEARGIFLADEVMAYLLTRFARDLGSLTALLHRLDRFSLAEKRAITIPLLKTMIAEEGATA
jgi:DnaA-homolog protein